jgi:hypothetical protein
MGEPAQILALNVVMEQSKTYSGGPYLQLVMGIAPEEGKQIEVLFYFISIVVTVLSL